METPKTYVGPGVLSDFDRAIQLEWIITNGLGGYASSTVLGINTRKYHGLLVASMNSPTDRHVFLSKLDEEIRISDKGYLLGSNEFRGTIWPEGYKHLSSFVVDPFPTFQYEIEGIYLKKTLFMPYLKNAIISRYEVNNNLNQPIEIRIFPLVNSRHFYDTTNRYELQLSFLQEMLEDGVHIWTSLHTGHLIISSTEGHYSSNEKERHWLGRVFFRVDDSRGESCLDDNYSPGFFAVYIGPKEKKDFCVSAVADRDESEARSLYSEMHKEETIKSFYEMELSRKHLLLSQFIKENPDVRVEDWLKHLILSTDLFLVSRKSTGKKSILAGYHWFEDWGRDSLISLTGLTLVTGRFEDAKEILLTFNSYCKDGVMPNRFPDKAGDQPIYNTADASLWFFNAVLQFLKYTGDFDFVYRELWKTMESIIEHYGQGTLFNVHMDSDGLIEHGPQLTWMDAVVDGKPVTPREGKPVEVQALWYNALKVMEVLAKHYDHVEEAEKYRLMAESARESFNSKFWNPRMECLFDVIHAGQSDPSLRPNQVMAVSLDFSMLDDRRKEKVLDIVWRRLWGTYGLKTLAEDDPRYIGKYVGDFGHRDAAYHNGVVWAWLTGPFVTAFLKVKKHQDYWRNFAFENFLQPLFLEELFRAGLGAISEIFDGDFPHYPRGCIAQAWSTAEPLRSFVEDILLKKPPFDETILSKAGDETFFSSLNPI